MSACLAWSADLCANLPMVSPQPWNQMVLSPPMGWNSWYGLYQKVSDKAVREQVELLISLGLKDLGYTYINLDDGWQGGRDQSGYILASSAKFPQGIAPLADYVHSRGLKFGIYTSPASTTCADPTGSLGHEALDAATFATRGIDFLKYDFCGAANDYKGCWLLESARSGSVDGRVVKVYEAADCI
jgi:alpha-galactosidase